VAWVSILLGYHMYQILTSFRIVVQFEDFKNPWPALEKYQHKYSCFNDDIQGTGAVILAGIINALKVTGLPAKDQRAVFMGAGSAGVGVAKQILQYFINEGLTEEEARKCFWFVDRQVRFNNLPFSTCSC
jgi:malate dehydrogenase (oxaloacetate-decarboxylating)(NADP+)